MRHMEEHLLVTLPVGRGFEITRSEPLYLDSAPSLLLDVFHIGTAVTNNLGTEVEAGNWIQIYRNLLLGPFALERDSQ